MIEETFQTELDLLVGCIKEMRRIQKDLGPHASQVFRATMEEYFRLPMELRNSFAYDALVRLSEQPAGSSKLRNAQDLERIKSMHQGQSFTLNAVRCYLQKHVYSGSLEGYMEYVTEEEQQKAERLGWPVAVETITYNDAWTAFTEGTMIL